MKKIFFVFLLSITSFLYAGDVQKIGGQTKTYVGKWIIENGSYTVKVSPKDDKRKNLLAFPFDVKKYAGKKVFFECEVRGEKISKPTSSWNGVKFMLVIKNADGSADYPSASKIPIGSFDWKKARFSVYIPKDAKYASIEIGLQQSSGTAVFRNIKYQVFEQKKIDLPENFKAQYSDKVKNMPALRGFMCNTKPYRSKDFVDMKAWGAKLIRYQMGRSFAKIVQDTSIEDYDKWLDEQIATLKIALDDAQKLGLLIVVDMHTPPGGREADREFRMFHDEKYAKYFVKAWQKIATAVKGHKAIWCYNLINEPWQKCPAKFDYLTLQYEAAKAIRKIDPHTPITIESNDASAESSFAYLQPLPLKDIIYQFHMYTPGEYTHQSVFDNTNAKKGIFLKYPDEKKTLYSKKGLEKKMKPVIDFQKKYGVRIYVGEFSTVRYAPGGAQYLQDLTDIFNKYNWDWTYHAFRESHFWDVEFCDEYKSRKKSEVDTERKKVLLDALKN